jgi:hypothetical protein
MTSGRAWVTAAMVTVVMLPFSAEAKGANKNKAAKGNGPAFCRSGAGHPVFGREWCREKGWDANRDRDRAERDRDRDDRDRDDRARDRDERDRDDRADRARDRFPWLF